MTDIPAQHHGPQPLDGGGTRFVVWAPEHESMALHIVAPSDRVVPMVRGDRGYWTADVPDAGPGTRYLYRLPSGAEHPDPASRHQPDGVHAPSAVVDPRFTWSDDGWTGHALSEYVIYELHVGTFTEEGTFDAAARDLQRLRDLGITAVEIMPVAAFPGERNWGYDGVYPWAVQESYGGPDAFRRFVDMAHRAGLSVILDVVYNHLGPEGNYLSAFGPYFTDRYKTPWGLALNFDGAWSDEVRDYFIGSALWFLDQMHVDALRLDAVHAIVDHTAIPFLRDVTAAVERLSEKDGWRRIVIAESDLNDPRMIRGEEKGGFGFDAQWSDDFHHALHVLLTGERSGYYAGYESVNDLGVVLRDGWLYQGNHSAFRNRRYGAPADGISPEQLIVSMQNHDQIGNRMNGDRLTQSLSDEAIRCGLGVLLLSPFTPMLFMGEEWGERAPFLYFISHEDRDLVEAVRKGRAEEFSSFGWAGDVPDPASQETFARSRIDRKQRDGARGRLFESWVRQLLELRSRHPALTTPGDVRVATDEEERVLTFRRGTGHDELMVVVNFASDANLVGVDSDGWKVIGSSKTGVIDLSGLERDWTELKVSGNSLLILARS